MDITVPARTLRSCLCEAIRMIIWASWGTQIFGKFFSAGDTEGGIRNECEYKDVRKVRRQKFCEFQNLF